MKKKIYLKIIYKKHNNLKNYLKNHLFYNKQMKMIQIFKKKKKNQDYKN